MEGSVRRNLAVLQVRDLETADETPERSLLRSPSNTGFRHSFFAIVSTELGTCDALWTLLGDHRRFLTVVWDYFDWSADVGLLNGWRLDDLPPACYCEANARLFGPLVRCFM